MHVATSEFKLILVLIPVARLVRSFPLMHSLGDDCFVSETDSLLASIDFVFFPDHFFDVLASGDRLVLLILHHS